MVQFIIGISGKQGSGKTTLSRNLAAAIEKAWDLKIQRLKFAGPIYDLHNEMQEYLEQYGIVKQEKHGRLLQRLGDLGKEIYSPSIWNDCMDAAIRQIHTASGDVPVVILIDDLRFPHEIEYLREVGEDLSAETTLIRLNAGDEVRKKRCHSWRETTGHDSEVSLDAHLDGWDLWLDTETGSQEENLEAVLNLVEEDMALLNPESLRVEKVVSEFNSVLCWLKERGKGANFRWDYLKDGTKQLNLISVEPVVPLDAMKEAELAKHAEETLKALEGVDFVFEKPTGGNT